MNFSFLFYELILVPFILFAIWLSKNRVAKDEPRYIEYTIGVLIILVLWGELAIHLHQWDYPFGVNLGLYIGSHPVELYIEAILTPLFILSCWEYIKRRK